MIVTVTPNTCVDYTLLLPEFRLGETLRATEAAWGMGGKAADAAWILGRWGVPSLAMGFVAGQIGQRMEAMLQARGVATDFVEAEGETRLNVVVVCAKSKQQSTLTANTLRVRAEHVDQLRSRYMHALDQASCVILGGSLPEGAPHSLYSDLIGAARARNIPVIFDSSGSALRMGLAARPQLIKPNQAELAELTGQVVKSLEDAYQAASKLQRTFGVDLIATMGEQGALALIGQKHYYIPPLRVEVVSTAGAGDAILAGMAVALSRREPPEAGLRLGFALAGAVLRTLATADYQPEDARRFLEQVQLLPWPS